MPGNQPSDPPVHPGTNLSASKSSLVRSKSLRLATSKPKLEQVGCSTLTRHGSIRGPRSQTSVTSSSKPPFSVFKKPALKPKPSFSSSKSSDHLENSSARVTSSVDRDTGKTASTSSPTKQPAAFSEVYRTPSDSPTSFHSDKSHSQDANSWCNSDLASHLKRLTEEHEKLQVEYARQRMQLLESMAFQSVSNLRRDQQYLSQSDSHLASIPENSPEAINKEGIEQSVAQTQEILLQNYKSEIFRLQEDNRKLQRKYWEQILNSELVVDEPCNGASQQIVDLIDKLDDKEKDLVEAAGRVQELENHLAASNLELQQCQDALQDQQRMLEESNAQQEELSKHARELRSALLEAKDHIDFLQIERSTLAEAYQETEQSLSATKAELMKEQSKINELMDRARKLYGKVKDKNLQVQLLRAELDRTQGNCRDMLLSQGAELTMISMHLSQMSMNVHSMLTAAADFAASELSLQKEMLEEIMADLDSESEASVSPSDQNDILKSDSQIPNSVGSQMNAFSGEKLTDIHKSLPDIFSCEPVKPLYSPAASESERPVSLVQFMVRAYEQTSRNDSKSSKQNQMKCSSEQISDSVKSSIENLSSINGDFSHISSLSKDSSPVASSAFKPVGMATAFRPVRQRSLESEVSLPEQTNLEEEKKATLETQLNQMNCLIKKVGKVITLTQEKFSSKIKALIEEKNSLQEELCSCKNKQYQIQADLNNKEFLIERANEKADQLVLQLKNISSEYAEEKENLIQKNEALTEEIKCLQAVNSEISEQLKLKFEKTFTEPNHGFRTNAEDICDKLNLKQEIVKLKAKVEQKEQLLQQLAQKFSRTNLSQEQNLKRAEKEIEVLDNVITKVYTILETNPDLVEKNEVLRNLLSMVSGNCTLTNIGPLEDKV